MIILFLLSCFHSSIPKEQTDEEVLAAPLLNGCFETPSSETINWPRQLKIFNNQFELRDLVSPCPPGVICIWSGIIVRTGTIKINDGAFSLEVTKQIPSTQIGSPTGIFFIRDSFLLDEYGLIWNPCEN